MKRITLERFFLLGTFVPLFTGKSARCPAFPVLTGGGEESRPCNHIYITRKPQPCLSRLNGMGGKLPFPYGYTKIYYGIDANTCGR